MLPEISFVLSIFAGDVRGEHVFDFIVRSPDGETTQIPGGRVLRRLSERK